MQRPVCLLLVVGACSGSSTSEPSEDASTYVPPDAACADGSELYEGQIMDFEAPTEALVGANVVVRGDPSRSAVTDSKGRFALCPPPQLDFVLDITGPGPELGGTMIEGSVPFERPYLPTFTPAKLDVVLARVGKTYDSSKGVVVVVAFGDMAQLDGEWSTLAIQHGVWAEGYYKDALLFPDVAPGMHVMSNAGTSRFDIEVAAGQITWVGLPPIYVGRTH